MVYQARFVKQLDGSRFQGSNCNCASDAMLINRATKGAKAPTSARIRQLTGDTSGGTNLSQVQAVNTKYFNITSYKKQPIEWDDLMVRAKSGRGFILQLYYRRLAGTKYDCFRGRFKDNHSIWVNHMNPDGTLHAADPGADGRYRGCPKGYQDYPRSLLKRAAGELDLTGLGTGGYRPLGYGHAFVLLAPRD